MPIMCLIIDKNDSRKGEFFSKVASIECQHLKVLKYVFYYCILRENRKSWKNPEKFGQIFMNIFENMK